MVKMIEYFSQSDPRSGALCCPPMASRLFTTFVVNCLTAIRQFTTLFWTIHNNPWTIHNNPWTIHNNFGESLEAEIFNGFLGECLKGKMLNGFWGEGLEGKGPESKILNGFWGEGLKGNGLVGEIVINWFLEKDILQLHIHPPSPLQGSTVRQIRIKSISANIIGWTMWYEHRKQPKTLSYELLRWFVWVCFNLFFAILDFLDFCAPVHVHAPSKVSK